MSEHTHEDLDYEVSRLFHRASMMNVGLGIGGTTVVLDDLINPVIKSARRVLELAHEQGEDGVRVRRMFTGAGTPAPLKGFADLVGGLFEGLSDDDLAQIRAEDDAADAAEAAGEGVHPVGQRFAVVVGGTIRDYAPTRVEALARYRQLKGEQDGQEG